MKKLALLTFALGLFSNLAFAQPVGDGQFISDGQLTASSSTLKSPIGKFASGDAGKSVQCGPSDYSGHIVDATIKTFTSPTEVELSVASTKTASNLLCQWGTDNTSAINSLIVNNSVAQLGHGCFLHRSLDVTHKGGITLQGSGNPVNNVAEPCVRGTWLVPMHQNRPGIDLSGSVGVTVKDLQLSTTLSPTLGNIGVFIAHSTTVTSTKIRVENVFISGAWQAAWYNYGVSAVVGRDLDVYTYRIHQIAMMITNDNPYGWSSQYVTTPTGTYAASQMLENFELHAHVPGGGSTAGHALRLRGVIPLSLRWGLIDSSSYNGTVMIESDNLGKHNALHYWESVTVYNEQSPQADYCWNVVFPTTYDSVTMLQTTCSAAKAARTGTKPSYLQWVEP